MKNWSERLRRILKVVGLTLLLILMLSRIPTSYHIVHPGITVDLSEIITVEGGTKRAEGTFLLTSVSTQRANLLSFLFVRLFAPANYELQPLTDQLPEDMDVAEYVEIMRQLMQESQMVAQAVAFEKAGYRTEITGEGVEVVKILPESKAHDLLREGDIIVAVDGSEVQMARQVVERVQAREIGVPVGITLKRDGERITVEIPTVEHSEEPGKAAIGILIQSYNLRYDLPLEVEIDTRDIIGPSAGVMFSLEILNQLIEEDITGGRAIAGTGTINLEEEVGPISGARHKLIAAGRDGADLFIIPRGNLAELEGFTSPVETLEIESLDEILAGLRQL